MYTVWTNKRGFTVAKQELSASQVHQFTGRNETAWVFASHREAILVSLVCSLICQGLNLVAFYQTLALMAIEGLKMAPVAIPVPVGREMVHVWKHGQRTIWR